MCILGSSPKVESPKVEKVAPTPQTITPTESNAVKDRTESQKKKRQQAAAEIGRTAGSSRVVANDTLLNQAQSGARQTLG